MSVREVRVERGRKHWYWKLIGKNGRILCVSETYSSKRMAVKTATRVHLQVLGALLVVKP